MTKMVQRPNYYQGILQLRDANEEVISFVRNQAKKRGNVSITKSLILPHGLDLYMTSQKFIRILGKKLKDNFGGELKISSKLHTKSREGKELHRVNVLFRLSRHRQGDIVSVRGEQLKITRMGKKIFAKELKTGKKRAIRVQELG